MKVLKFRGLKLLAAVALVYLLLYFFDTAKTLLALKQTGYTLMKILPIFAVIIPLTALLNYKLKPEQFARHLGEKSGTKGWITAILAGIVSHGPMYAIYPILEEIQQHGIKKGLIATFFYARSIKVPMLPLMIEYFGIAFTIILTIYILIASLLQGLLIEKLCTSCD